MAEITEMLRRMSDGDPRAGDELMRVVYAELHQLASARLRSEAPANTYQATALVHEAWLRLGGDAQPNWQNRRHYFGAAAEAMRRILIDRARHHSRQRHGGGQQRIDIASVDIPDAETQRASELLAVNESLERLAALDPAKAELVKLRYFADLPLAEAAAMLDISLATANRWWAFARAWLLEELQREGVAGGLDRLP